MKYTFEGLEKEIEDIVIMVEKTAKDSRKYLDEKNTDSLERLSKAMAVVSLMGLIIQSKRDVLGDLLERTKVLGMMRDKKFSISSNSVSSFDNEKEKNHG